MNPRPVSLIKPLVILASLALLALGLGCGDSTNPTGDALENPFNLPDVTVRDPARVDHMNGEVALTLDLSAPVAQPGETVQFDAAAANLLDEPLEYYGLVCWPDSPRFFLVDAAGTSYRIEWQPAPPCPASLKRLGVGETAMSRDWFSGWALREGTPVELPPGDYTARAVYEYRPLSASGDQSLSFSVEAPFRWVAPPQ